MKVAGECVGCKKKYESAQAARHLSACSKIKENGDSTTGYLLKVFARYDSSVYWMLLAVPGSETLEDLDEFLRETWLECCGHLSMFIINGEDYSSYSEDGDLSMDVRADKVLAPGLKFDYVYDFGSSTDLKINVVKTFDHCEEGKIKILMRNDPPIFSCEECDESANTICPYCSEQVCFSCAKSHDCVEDESMMMPLVNSPRTGVCAYSG